MKRILPALLVLSIQTLVFAQSKKSVFDPSTLSLTWGVVENNHNGEMASLNELTLTNKGKQTLPATGWKIYFNFVRDIREEGVTGNVEIRQVNGDFFYIAPKTGFKSIGRNKSVKIDFVSSDWVVNFTDAPRGFYLVWDNGGAPVPINNYAVLPSTSPKQYLRFAGDKVGLITPADLYAQNKNTIDLPAEKLIKIFPTPREYKETGGSFQLNANVSIASEDAFMKEANFLSGALQKLIGKKPAVQTGSNGSIVFKKKEMVAEGYELKVSSNGVEISAGDAAGAFYAIQSLLSLTPPASFSGVQSSISIPAVEVRDAPRFGYRAFMLDVGRNFQPKPEILKVLDLMALYKLNTFHLHFSEDEGWRVQMPSLPELTEVGGRRGHTLDNKSFLQPAYGSGPDTTDPHGSGFYTSKDFVEILKYANDRHISIIPEIETPGHARAAVKSMTARYEKYKKAGNMEEAERYLLHDVYDASRYQSVQMWNDNVIDVSLPSTYSFLERVIDDIREMYNQAGAPLKTIHMGGDEVPGGVWEKSPAYILLRKNNPAIQSTEDLWYYYFGRVNKILKQRGLFLSGWEEVGMRKTMLDGQRFSVPNPEFVNEHFQLDVWNNVLGWGSEDLAYKLANSGYKVVLSCVSNNYFDMAYYKDFSEPGYYWGSFVDVDKPFYFIPYDYFKNSKEDRMGNPIDPAIFVGKQRLTDFGKSNIVGVKGLLWAENLISTERLEYMLLPKLFGVAERAWAADPDWATEKDMARAETLYQSAWSHFVNVIGKRELPRLDYFAGGWNYRIPVPGMSNDGGQMKVNMQIPGFVLRYTTDGSEPTAKSKIYSGNIPEKGAVKIKAFDSRGRSGRVAEIKN